MKHLLYTLIIFCFSATSISAQNQNLTAEEKQAVEDLYNSFDSTFNLYGLKSFSKYDRLFKPPLVKSFANDYFWNITRNNILYAPVKWVNDHECIFSETEKLLLNKYLTDFEQETTIEIAVLSLDSSTVTKNNFDSLVTGIGKFWHVGKKETNNGIIVGISASLRSVRISTGIGIEAKLSNAKVKYIIDEFIIPEFRKGNFYQGLENGLQQITLALR